MVEKDLRVANRSRNTSKLNASDRVGFGIEAKDTADALRKVREAEAAGIRQVWMTMGGAGAADPLTFYAAAALQTNKIRLGTSIIPTNLPSPPHGRCTTGIGNRRARPRSFPFGRRPKPPSDYRAEVRVADASSVGLS